MNTLNNINRYLSLDAFDILINYLAIFIISHSFLFVIKKSKNISFYNEDENSNFHSDKYLIISSYILFFVGIVSNYLYLRAYGSYSNYLNYSGLLRSGVMLINNKFSFLMPFRNCILFSSYLFAKNLKKSKHKFITTIFLVISIISSFRVLYANKGRLGFIIYILLLLIALFKDNKNQNINFKALIKVLFVGLIGGAGIMVLGVSLGRNENISFINLLNQEITFAFLNFSVIREYSNVNIFRYFFDIVSFIIYILPSSIWGGKLGIKTASNINTVAWLGSAKGTNGVYGEMPIDFISLSYMQLGFFGIFILPMFFAYFYHKLFKKIDEIKDSSIKLFCKFFIFISIGVHSLFYSDPYLIISRNFGFIVFIIIYYFLNFMFKRKSIKKG